MLVNDKMLVEAAGSKTMYNVVSLYFLLLEEAELSQSARIANESEI